MNRRDVLGQIGLMVGALWPYPLLSRGGTTSGREAAPGADFSRLDKPLAQWRTLLPDAAYRVLFEEDTERPFSSPLNHEKRPGTYLCAACFLPLFDAQTKYDSGTGWPSFFRPIAGRVGTRSDRRLLLVRTEYHCARCGGHQGHVFDDGPAPTGQRWCNNGVALRFIPAGQALPPLRH